MNSVEKGKLWYLSKKIIYATLEINAKKDEKTIFSIGNVEKLLKRYNSCEGGKRKRAADTERKEIEEHSVCLKGESMTLAR